MEWESDYKFIFKIVLTFFALAMFINYVYRPIDKYTKDIENIKNGTVCEKSISHGYLGWGTAHYHITVKPDHPEEIRVPWFSSAESVARTFTVTESEYEEISIGDYYEQ